MFCWSLLFAGDCVFGLVYNILNHIGLSIGVGAAPILRTAEGKDEPENEGKQQKSNCEAHTQLEGLSQVNHHLDGKIDVVERDQQKQELPAAAIQLLAKNISVVEGNDTLPALTPHLFVDHPRANQRQNYGDDL